MKNICILGSTGSIGTQTMEIIKKNGGYKVKSLAVNTNITLLEKQIREFGPQKVCVYDEARANDLKGRVADLEVTVLSGMEGLIELASDTENDLVVTSMVGMIGIRPTIAAINAGCDIALANKETLVTAGHIIMPLIREKGVNLYPIDSEHSAIWQCLDNTSHDELDKILLTASGGPFRGKSYAELEKMTAADALRHPNWDMGNKITIDSASMVNKALEVMEAKWLFDVDAEDITVVIQPESIIHSAVQFKDGAIIAQLGVPDMRIPIQYALYYPKRLSCPARKLDLFELGRINFEKPDYNVFRGLSLGLHAIKQGGSACTVFNAANEYAVDAFLHGRIGFTQIYDIIERCMDETEHVEAPSLNTILSLQESTGEKVLRIIG